MPTALAQPSPDDFKEPQAAYADAVLHPEIKQQLEQINKEAELADGKPVFVGYDLDREIDFRGWPEAGRKAIRLEDGFTDIPAHRVRVVGEENGKLVHACYEKVYNPINSNDLNAIARAANDPPFHWVISYRIHDWEFCDCTTAKLEPITGDGYGALYHHGCGRYRKTRVEGNMRDHVASIGLGMSDDEFNGYYPTIQGTDIAHHNAGASGMDQFRGGGTLYGDTRLDNQNRVIEEAKPISGGTEIKGGRAEWRQKTKGLIAWDSGTQAHLDRQKAEVKIERRERDRVKLEKALNKGPQKPFDL